MNVNFKYDASRYSDKSFIPEHGSQKKEELEQRESEEVAVDYVDNLLVHLDSSLSAQ